MKIIFSPKCLEYEQSGHPESPERVRKTYEFLKSRGFEFVEPEPAEEEDILLVHTKEHVEKIKKRQFFDMDTPNLENIYEYARLSVGAAIKAMEMCLSEKTFSLMRPPGHHASQNNLEGFCYFNNIAVAVKKALKNNLAKRVAIIDIDVHHGNGTQAIFLGDQNVLYVSLHQFGIYPGTGLKSEKNCINYPLAPETNERDYLMVFQEAIEKIKSFSPNMVAVSAGFDTYRKDPLANINLDIETYRRIGSIISDLKLPVFSVLEGGYSEKLPECIYQYLIGLG